MHHNTITILLLIPAVHGTWQRASSLFCSQMYTAHPAAHFAGAPLWLFCFARLCAWCQKHARQQGRATMYVPEPYVVRVLGCHYALCMGISHTCSSAGHVASLLLARAARSSSVSRVFSANALSRCACAALRFCNSSANACGLTVPMHNGANASNHAWTSVIMDRVGVDRIQLVASSWHQHQSPWNSTRFRDTN